MQGSVEKHAHRALVRLIFWRIVGDLFVLTRLPFVWCEAFMKVGAEVFATVARVLRAVEMSLFCLEIDAARRYKLLTDFDFGAATGQPSRYASLDAALRERLAEQILEAVEDDDA